MTSPVNHVSKDSAMYEFNSSPALYSSTLVIKLLKDAEILTVTLYIDQSSFINFATCMAP